MEWLGAILMLAVIARNAYLVIDEWSTGGIIWRVLMVLGWSVLFWIHVSGLVLGKISC
ncbi:hypothetical protein Q037_00986 [Pseudomonas aeruginosa BWHPSA024]|nr:hypothetical protein Q037_00986 [Pseudomonas aeruginosa BWHPSA024]EZN51257.1 hypothetical protein AJ76_00569 [Pseudomonas aeruginosa BWH036]